MSSKVRPRASVPAIESRKPKQHPARRKKQSPARRPNAAPARGKNALSPPKSRARSPPKRTNPTSRTNKNGRATSSSPRKGEADPSTRGETGPSPPTKRQTRTRPPPTTKTEILSTRDDETQAHAASSRRVEHENAPPSDTTSLAGRTASVCDETASASAMPSNSSSTASYPPPLAIRSIERNVAPTFGTTGRNIRSVTRLPRPNTPNAILYR